MTKWLLLITLCFSVVTYADDIKDWYGDKPTGWHYYDDPKDIKKEEAKRKQQDVYRDMPRPELEIDPLKWREAYRKKGEWLMAKSIREETEQSALDYQLYQNEQTRLAKVFSVNVDHAIRKNKLDPSIEHENTQTGNQIFLDEQKKAQRQNIEAIKGQYGLVLFVKGSCPYCHRQAPITQQLADNLNLELLAVSLDKQAVPGLNNVVPDNGIAESFDVTYVPSLYLVNFHTNEHHIVKYGMAGMYETEQMINEVINYEKLR